MSRVPIVPTLVVLIAAGIMIRLGFWQIDRLHQKEAMIASFTAAGVYSCTGRPASTAANTATPATATRALAERRADESDGNFMGSLGLEIRVNHQGDSKQSHPVQNAPGTTVHSEYFGRGYHRVAVLV